MALVVMVIVQTAVLAMNSSFGTFGEWFQNWLQNWISLLRSNIHGDCGILPGR